MPIRPPSSVAIAMRKPWPSSPSSRSSVDDRVERDVVRDRRVEAELLLRRASPRPGRLSTRNAVTPRAERVSASVRAKSRNVPPNAAVRDPLLRAAELPAAVVALGARAAARRRPTRARLRQREAADRLAARRAAARTARAARRCRTAGSGACTADVCTATVTPTPASARESSSSTRMYDTKSAPAPP